MKELKTSKWLPPKGYAGITLWPFGIYVMEKYLDRIKLKVHENLHWGNRKNYSDYFSTYFMGLNGSLKFSSMEILKLHIEI